MSYFNDRISDFLTRIRNGALANHLFIDIDWSKSLERLAKLLKEEGFIANFLVRKENESRGRVRVFLKYDENRKPLIQKLIRKSKPGLRKYIGYKEIRPVCGGLGISIFSTSKGVMTGDEARKEKVGGELMCEIW